MEAVGLCVVLHTLPHGVSKTALQAAHPSICNLSLGFASPCAGLHALVLAPRIKPQAAHRSLWSAVCAAPSIT